MEPVSSRHALRVARLLSAALLLNGLCCMVQPAHARPASDAWSRYDVGSSGFVRWNYSLLGGGYQGRKQIAFEPLVMEFYFSSALGMEIGWVMNVWEPDAEWESPWDGSGHTMYLYDFSIPIGAVYRWMPIRGFELVARAAVGIDYMRFGEVAGQYDVCSSGSCEIRKDKGSTLGISASLGLGFAFLVEVMDHWFWNPGVEFQALMLPDAGVDGVGKVNGGFDWAVVARLFAFSISTE